jgi:hypothetical protein
LIGAESSPGCLQISVDMPGTDMPAICIEEVIRHFSPWAESWASELPPAQASRSNAHVFFMGIPALVGWRAGWHGR